MRPTAHTPGLRPFACQAADVNGNPAPNADLQLTQVRVYSDGSWIEALGTAGLGRFHAFHGHIHYQNAYYFQLFRVNDVGWSPGKGRPKHLDAIGPGGKLGVNPGDEKFADWNRFNQAPQNDCPRGAQDQCHEREGSNLLLDLKVNAGWGDVYEWNRGGNYVDFPDDGVGPLAGYYVLRGTSDPDHLIIESNNKDNVAYGFIQVLSNGTVLLLERGYGTDPWDGAKSVAVATP